MGTIGLLPLNQVPSSSIIYPLCRFIGDHDKWVHFVMFFLLTFQMWHFTRCFIKLKHSNNNLNNNLDQEQHHIYNSHNTNDLQIPLRLAVLCVSLSAGILSESIQSLIPYRTFDYEDMLSNCLGCSLAMLVLFIWDFALMVVRGGGDRWWRFSGSRGGGRYTQLDNLSSHNNYNTNGPQRGLDHFILSDGSSSGSEL